MAILPQRALRWTNAVPQDQRSWTCGYCDHAVASTTGFNAGGPYLTLICPWCCAPTFFDGDAYYPSPSYGKPVANLPEDVAALYQEARDCMSVRAHTAATLACRKIVMHVAVDQIEAAESGMAFVQYVELLFASGYITPSGKVWVDHIRTTANEANHEIVLMAPGDAASLIDFTEMLLRLVYDYPARVPATEA